MLSAKNLTIDNCGIGISMPADANAEFDGLVITNTQRAIELRDPPGVLQQLGLSPETPADLVTEVLRFLEQPGVPVEEKQAFFSSSRITGFIAGAGNLASVFSALLSVADSGLTASVGALLSSLND